MYCAVLNGIWRDDECKRFIVIFIENFSESIWDDETNTGDKNRQTDKHIKWPDHIFETFKIDFCNNLCDRSLLLVRTCVFTCIYNTYIHTYKFIISSFHAFVFLFTFIIILIWFKRESIVIIIWKLSSLCPFVSSFCTNKIVDRLCDI